MDNKKVQTLDGEIMLVQEVPCQVKLNDHNGQLLFRVHKEPVSLKICKEDALPECFIRTITQWAVEEYLEERRFEEICQSMNCEKRPTCYCISGK